MYFSGSILQLASLEVTHLDDLIKKALQERFCTIAGTIEPVQKKKKP